MSAQPSIDAAAPPAVLEQPAYSFADVDRLSGATSGTARYWLRRYGGLTGSAASFIDLVEVAFVSRLKRSGMSPATIAHMFADVQDRLGVARPIAHAKLRNALVHGRLDGPAEYQQIAFAFLPNLDYIDGWIDQWWPAGRGEPIVIHPAYGWGFPTIARTGVRTEILYDAVRSGKTIEMVAADYNATPNEVARAVAFESRLAR